jgi:hypothetical protein
MAIVAEKNEAVDGWNPIGSTAYSPGGMVVLTGCSMIDIAGDDPMVTGPVMWRVELLVL